MIFGRFKRKLVFAGVIGALAVSCGFSSVSGDAQKTGNISVQEQPEAESEPDAGQEDSETESVLKWLTDKASSGEVDLKDEDSIRRAIDEAEEEFGTSYDEKNFAPLFYAGLRCRGRCGSADRLRRRQG